MKFSSAATDQCSQRYWNELQWFDLDIYVPGMQKCEKYFLVNYEYI